MYHCIILKNISIFQGNGCFLFSSFLANLHIELESFSLTITRLFCSLNYPIYWDLLPKAFY